MHLVRAGNDYVLLGSGEHGLVPIHRYTQEQAREAGLTVLDEPAPLAGPRSPAAPLAAGQTRHDPMQMPAPGSGRHRAGARVDGAPLNLTSSNAVQILLLVGGLTLVPAILFTVTGFSRILIVLGFIRSAIGTNSAPPNQVLVGIALFLTIFVMSPTISAIKKVAVEPLQAHEISTAVAIERAELPLRQFMFRQTPPKDIELFVNLSHGKQPKTRAEVPTEVLIPAFIVSELEIAFKIGFLIFLPFLIIELIVASTLMSMGMIMLPPTFISLPFKILLFVLVDGWDLVIKSLVLSFH